MGEYILEPHIFAVMCASSSCAELIELLPGGDIRDEMEKLLITQYQILTHILEDKHYGTDRLEEFIEYNRNLFESLEKLKNAQE